MFVRLAAVSLVVFALVYKLMPHIEVTWRDVLLGALVAALGFEVLKIGFTQYAARFGDYNATYGTLGFVIAFLALAYFDAQVALFGAEFRWAYLEVTAGGPPSLSVAMRKSPRVARWKSPPVAT